MVNYGDPEDFKFDVMTGVSAGAINTGVMAGWEIGTEKELADWGSDLWNNLSSSDIYQDWALGKVSGALIMSGLLDNAPLYNFLQHTVDQFDGFKRRVTISAANIENGEYTEFDQTNMNWKEVAEAAVCSSSIPGVFPPHHWHGRGWFMDGGTIYNVNLEAAIR